MSDKSNEQISNLMDGELEIQASQFLLKRMASDPTLSQKWDNYHLIKSCLQKERQEPLVINIASRVTRQLSRDAMVHKKLDNTPINKQFHRWLKPVIGLGIAASVAFMSVTLLQNQQVQGITQPRLEATIASVTPNRPALQVNIPASVASSAQILPPASLSRFPSISSKQSVGYNQVFSKSNSVPYLIIINQAGSVSSDAGQYTPIIKNNISD